MAAFELPLFQYSFQATASLATKRFYAVKQDTANPGNIVIVAAATDKPVGLLQNNPGAAAAGTVMLSGISKFVAKGTIHVGDILGLGSDGDGRIAKITPGTDTTIYVLGQAIQEAADNDVCAGLFNFMNIGRAA
jgi:hypothetical protein